MNISLKRGSFGIQQKLFFFVVAVLLFNIIILLLLGSAVFEKLYVNNKLQELENGADAIKSAYSYGTDSDEYTAALTETENRNIIVQVFHRDPAGEIIIDYSTRMGFKPHDNQPDDRRGDKFDEMMLNDFYTSLYDKGLEERPETEKYIIFNSGGGNEKAEPHQRNNLILYTKLEGDLYLSLDTPRQYLAETAELATKACATISLFTLVIASLALYFICRRITAPITEIQRTAEGIAELNFTARCAVHGSDELGRLSGAINDMSDSLQKNISDLETANQLLRDDLHRQEQQDMMRKRFIANVSHDFKTPLTLITSYSDSIRELNDDQRGQRLEYLDIISGEGGKMSHMVQALLNLSRLESGMVQLTKMAFSINEIINEITYKHKFLAEKRGLTVKRVLPDEIIVSADYQRIEQVFVNLFENAVKYTPEGGKIVVSTKRCEGRCLVSVFNTGGGIAQSDLEKLFISFYRTDKAREQETQSYGLGLAIVRSIMELHGQAYGVRNLPEGIEFWFNLDIAQIDGDEAAE